jgi:regulatory protein
MHMKDNQAITENNALVRLMELCSRSEKSSFDILNKLKEWGLENKAESILKKLKKENYIDDTRYATAFVHDKILFNKWGKIKVSYLLKRQGMHQTDIDLALEAINDNEYQGMIFSEMQKKKVSLKSSSSLLMKSKLYNFAAQRGYEPELIRTFFESLR